VVIELISGDEGKAAMFGKAYNLLGLQKLINMTLPSMSRRLDPPFNPTMVRIDVSCTVPPQ